MPLHPKALAVKVDDSRLHADIRVGNLAIAAAHAAISSLYQHPGPAPAPSDYTDATKPAEVLVKAMSNYLMEARREAFREAQHTIQDIR